MPHIGTQQDPVIGVGVNHSAVAQTVGRLQANGKVKVELAPIVELDAYQPAGSSLLQQPCDLETAQLQDGGDVTLACAVDVSSGGLRLQSETSSAGPTVRCRIKTWSRNLEACRSRW